MILQILLTLVVTLPKPIAVTLAWDYPPEEMQLITGFRIYHGPSSRNYTTMLEAGNALEFRVESLTEQTEYFFAATAYNAIAGLESDYSNEVNYTTPVFQPKLRLTNSVIHFASITNQNYLIEETWDFKNWAGLGVVAETNGVVTFPIQQTNQMRFFRAQRLPKDLTTAMTIAMGSIVKTLPPHPKPPRRFFHANEMKGAELLMKMVRESRKPKVKTPPFPR